METTAPDTEALYLSLELKQWLLAFISAMILGISKAGVKGIAVIVVTLMAIAFGSKASTGILVPLLLVGDTFAIGYYRRHVQTKYLFQLLPWMTLGLIGGVLIGKDLPDSIFKYSMAGIIIIGLVTLWIWERQKPDLRNHSWWFAGILGIAAGISTMIGNMAGAFSNLYFLSIHLPKNDFIGTAAWLFFITNSIKVIFHITVWHTLTWETFQINLFMIPFMFLGLAIGARLVSYITESWYRKFIMLATLIGAILILLS